MGKSIGAVAIGAAIALLIYHVFFVMKPLDAVKLKVSSVDKTVASRADTVRRNIEAMKTDVNELNQRVSSLETSQEVQQESLAIINTALEDVKMAAMQAQEKSDLAVKLSKARSKTAKGVPEPTKGKGVKSKKSAPPSPMAKESEKTSGADSDTLLAELIKGQDKLFQRVKDIEAKLNHGEESDEKGETDEAKKAKKSKLDKKEPSRSVTQFRSWKNSFAF